jgi:NAD(P)H dehydrogenase (quinone)
MAAATVSVIYHSGFGHTAKAADAVATGAKSVEGVEVKVFVISDNQFQGGRWQDDAVIGELSASDAIIFGSPTYMGMVSGQFKSFADATAPLWFNRGWKDKIAGGFTSSGFTSGDKTMTIHYFVTLAGQLRMLWVGPGENPSSVTGDGQDLDRNGHYLGVGVVGNMQDPTSPSAGDLKTAELYGKRIAEVTRRWTKG